MKHEIHSNSKWLIAATVAVAVVAGGLALGSNMGFKFNAQTFGPPTPPPKGDNWISLPDYSPYNKANILCTQLGMLSTGANGSRGTVSRLNASTGVFSTPYVCGSNTALAFNLVVGEAVRLRNLTTINSIVVGSDNPNNTLPLAALGAPPIGDNWVSVPYHTTAIKASDLCTDIGLLSTGPNGVRGTVSRLTASTGVFSTPYVCGSNTALAFNLLTGDGARIRTPVAKSWLPSHF
jgi:hypothetical protein